VGPLGRLLRALGPCSLNDYCMVPRKRGAILITGASASLRGRAGYGAFNSAKAGLRILAQAMAKEYGPEGIHVGHVVVDGAVDGERYAGALLTPTRAETG
jgi:NAD(P)-dependent dehydrogenase (short-subunit alcohol dehydrogenase family)